MAYQRRREPIRPVTKRKSLPHLLLKGCQWDVFVPTTSRRLPLQSHAPLPVYRKDRLRALHKSPSSSSCRNTGTILWRAAASFLDFVFETAKLFRKLFHLICICCFSFSQRNCLIFANHSLPLIWRALQSGESAAAGVGRLAAVGVLRPLPSRGY